jgi:hypothetical protein
MIQQLKKTQQELTVDKILPVHPSFRIIALATPPNMKNQWLTSEVISMFHFHVMPTLTLKEKSKLLAELFPDTSDSVLATLLNFDQKAYEVNSKEKSSHQALQLSLRQLIRICKHTVKYPKQLYAN